MRQEEKDNLRAVIAFILFIVVILSIFDQAVRMGAAGRAEEGKKGLWKGTSIRRHLNDSTGEDLISEIIYRKEEEAAGRREGRFMDAVREFGDYVPLQDIWAGYMDREYKLPFWKTHLCRRAGGGL